MATVQFVPMSSSSHRTSSNALVLRAAAAPTTSYVASTNVADCSGWEYVILGIDYINGDETSIQIVPQLYDGTTWRDASFKATQATSVSEVTPDVLNITKATINTYKGGTTVWNTALPPISVLGAQQFRVLVKSTGGTPTGTIAFSATAGVTVKSR